MKNLRKDLYAVARDAEALLKATADVTGERVQEVRARTEKTLRQALDHLYRRPPARAGAPCRARLPMTMYAIIPGP